MALLFLDSFDHYTESADKYTTVWSGSGDTPTTGRHGNGLVSQGNTIHVMPASARCLVGGAWYLTNSTEDLFRIADQATGLLACGNDAAGRLWITIGSETVSSAVDVVKLNQWYYVELDLTFTSGGGATVASLCKAYVDGALVIDATDVGPGGPATPSTYFWTGVGHGGFGNVSTIDDFYVADGSGAAPWNGPVGDLQIDVIRPNGAGFVTQWTVTGAASNWDATNDLVPDDDTTIVTAATTALSDLYAMEDVSTGNTILGAQLLVNARRSDDGFATLTPLLRHAGTTTALTGRALSPSYFYRTRDVFVTMPNGDPLTDAHVNALQAGIRRDA